MGKARKTIQNWEASSSMPDIAEYFRWFRICHENPVPYLMEVIYPKSNSRKQTDARKIAHDYIDTLTDQELECINFLLSGEYGGSRYACLQEIVCNLQTPILNRYTTAVMVENNYRVAKDMGELTAPDRVQPDMDAFCDAIAQGRSATIQKMISYSNLSDLAKEEYKKERK